MRKPIRIFIIALCFFSISTTLFAEWQQLNPSIAGGPLSGRYQSSMTSIGNGKVLLFGGRNSTTYFNDTWILDITRNRWTKLSPNIVNGVMNNRFGHQIVSLGENSALLYGGRYDGYNGDTITWIYDHSIKTWTNVNPTVNPGSLFMPGMCRIDTGRVMLFGGQNYPSYNTYTYYDRTWIYNVSDNQWRLMSPTIVGEGFNTRYMCGLAYIGNRRALMFGGTNNGSGIFAFADTWLYDLDQAQDGQWTKLSPTIEAPTGTLLTARRGLDMVYIGGDRVLLFGGAISSNEKSNQIWMYDLSDNKWTYIDSSSSGGIPSARDVMGFASIGLGQVAMFGGSNTSGITLSDTWRFSIPSNIQDSIDWQITSSGVQFNWVLPEALSGANFSVYRDGFQIASSATQGTAVDGIIPFTFLDPNPATNRIYRYQIKETYPVMNTEIFYPEIGVPYCQ